MASLSLLVFGGCASQSRESAAAAPPPPQQPTLAGVVLPTEAVLAWESSRQGIPPFDRFEFSRNDEQINLVSREPINATRQWPQPARPREEHVRFWYWRQQ
jgi:hypothetical protein